MALPSLRCAAASKWTPSIGLGWITRRRIEEGDAVGPGHLGVKGAEALGLGGGAGADFRLPAFLDDVRRRHQQHVRSLLAVGAVGDRAEDALDQHRIGAGNVHGGHGEARLEVVGAQHQHDEVDRLMAFQRDRQAA